MTPGEILQSEGLQGQGLEEDKNQAKEMNDIKIIPLEEGLKRRDSLIIGINRDQDRMRGEENSLEIGHQGSPNGVTRTHKMEFQLV